MFGKIALAATVAAVLAFSIAPSEARGGGGGFRGVGIGRSIGISRPFVGRPGFVGRRLVVPLISGVGIYGASCWGGLQLTPFTPFGWQRVWVCNYPYSDGFAYGYPY